MATIVPYLIVLWIPLVAILFSKYQKRRMIFLAVLVGTLYLPNVGAGDAADVDSSVFKIGPILFTKDLTICYALLAAIVFYDFSLLTSSSPGWVDIPMLVWCFMPLVSAGVNEAPPDGSWWFKDGLLQVWSQGIRWGIPYLAGRLYLTDCAAFRDMAVMTILFALLYAPLCMFEARMSPQLHGRVYGFIQHSFAQTKRFDGWRPMVFFQHGLALAMWIVSCLLLATWLAWNWVGDRARKFMIYSLVILVPTTILMKSLGALALGVFGGFILFLGKVFPSRIWLLGLIVISPLYASVRIAGTWRGEDLVEYVNKNVGEERGGSLEYRLMMEDLLIAKALEQPVFGWGGWGRNRVYDEATGKDLTVTDGMWIISFGYHGYVGLFAVGGIFFLPALVFMFRFSPKEWSQPALAPALVCAMIMVLWGIDSLMNAMYNPIYLFLSGGVISLKTMTMPEEGPITQGQRTDRFPSLVARAARQPSEYV